MAVNMFLKLDGVDGEAGDKQQSKQIDVLSRSLGAANHGSAHASGGAPGSGKVQALDLHITKYFALCLGGRSFPPVAECL
jgi:type VI secretion system secreted protein Hcp